MEILNIHPEIICIVNEMINEVVHRKLFEEIENNETWGHFITESETEDEFILERMQSHGYGLTDMKRTSTVRRGLKRMRDNVEDYQQLTKRQRSDSMITNYGTDPDEMDEMEEDIEGKYWAGSPYFTEGYD